MMDIEIDKRAGYTSAHVAKAIMILESPCGRERLMNELKLNEASARTMLNGLQKNKFVEPTKKGHVLTRKGKRFLEHLKKNIVGPIEVEKNGITMSKYNIAYLVKKKASKIKFGLEQRDQAILLGADGLTTLIYKNRLIMPGMRWRVPKRLENIFSLERNDVILIGSASDKRIADLAALNSAVALVI